ncbi:MAG: extracellular solute-binding protein [Oscillospiraceae bacterium]|nr:extracellular solute-binding protein [Oscillospiraceae bacterium]
MKKSLLAILLAAAMMVMVFAGCGSAAGSAAEAAASDAVSSAAEAAEAVEEAAETVEAAPAEEAVPAEDEASAETMPGADTHEYPEITYPLVDEPTTLTYWQAWPPFLNEISEPQDAAMFAKMEEITGIHLDITAVSTETDATDFMLMCATGDMTDFMQGGASHYTGGGTKAIEDDILVDMLPYLEEYSANYYRIMMEDPTFYKTVVNDEGQVPSLIGIYKDPYYTDQGMWIRQDILDAVGKEVPTTVDELDDVLGAFKDHGLTDPYVLLYEGTCDLLSRAYDAGDKVVDGQIVSNALTDNTKDMLKKLHEWYDKGFVNVDFVTYTDSNTKPPQSVVLSDNGGMFVEDVASIAGYYLMSNNPDFNLQPMGQVRLTPDQELNTGFIGQYAADKYSLSMSTNCSDPRLAIQYMDYLFSDEGFVMANYGIEGETYTIDENGDYQFTDLILNNPQGFDWQLCQSLYINPGFPCLNDLAAQELTYNDAQKAAVPTWTAAYDSADETMPNQNWLSYTTEESYRRAELQTDLETYQEEFRLKAITGQVDIDAEWDNYVATCKSMGFDELQEISQAALTRYLEK